MGAAFDNCYGDHVEPQPVVANQCGKFDRQLKASEVGTVTTPPYKRSRKRRMPWKSKEETTVSGGERIHITKSHDSWSWGVHMNVEGDPPWTVHELDPGDQWESLGIEKGWQIYAYNSRPVSKQNKDSIATKLKSGEACTIEFIPPEETSKADVKETTTIKVERVFIWSKIYPTCLLFVLASLPSIIGTIFYIVYDDKSFSFVYLFISLAVVFLTMLAIYSRRFELDFSLTISGPIIIILNLLFTIQQGSQGIESTEGWALFILILCFTFFSDHCGSCHGCLFYANLTDTIRV